MSETYAFGARVFLKPTFGTWFLYDVCLSIKLWFVDTADLAHLTVWILWSDENKLVLLIWNKPAVCCVRTLVAMPECNRPVWELTRDSARIGAASPISRSEEEDCLDLCIDDRMCVGVDVDYELDPVLCWLHYNRDDYIDSNLYGQDKTNSYQLLTRCADVTTATGTATSQYKSRPHVWREII